MSGVHRRHGVVLPHGGLVGDSWRPGLGDWDIRAVVGHTSRSLLTVETYCARTCACRQDLLPAEYVRVTRAIATEPAVLGARTRRRGRTERRSRGRCRGDRHLRARLVRCLRHRWRGDHSAAGPAKESAAGLARGGRGARGRTWGPFRAADPRGARHQPSEELAGPVTSPRPARAPRPTAPLGDKAVGTPTDLLVERARMPGVRPAVAGPATQRRRGSSGGSG